MNTEIASTCIQIGLDVLVVVIMIFASISDIKTRKVDPKYQWLLLLVATLNFGFALGSSLAEPGIWLDLLGGGALMFIIYTVLFLIFRAGIGGADAKVTSIMALYMGVIQGIIFVIVHCVAGLAYSLFVRVTRKKKIASVPLMPFLLFSFLAVRLFVWINLLLK